MLRILAVGIVASVVGGGILLVVDSLLLGDKAPDNALQVEAVRVVESLSVEVSKPEENLEVESEIDDLKELVSVASKVHGSSLRDAEFSKIIDQALSEEQPEFAFTVAKKIHRTNSRDQEYSKIISRCLSLGRYQFAVRVADAVWRTNSRNEEYRKIIAAGVAKRRGSPISD